MPRRKTTEEFKKDVKDIRGDEFDLSETVYTNSKSKVTAICKKHGKFRTLAASLLIEGRQVCRKCAYEARRLTTQEFVQRSKEVHGNKYDYSKTVYEHSCKKVKIVCPIHGGFMQIPTYHLQGNGCRECGFDKIAKGNSINKKEFILKAKQAHGDFYNYDKVVYIGTGYKVKIVCPDHGVFEQTAGSHLRGRGCMKCSREKQSKGTYKKGLRERFNKIHNSKYNYPNLEELYNGTHEKVKMICPIHGGFQQTPHSHLRGSGCYKCGIESRRHTIEHLLRKFKEEHGEKYNYPKLESEYIGFHKKITIECPFHGLFKQHPYSHLTGHTCSKCSGESRRLSLKELRKRFKEAHDGKYSYPNLEEEFESVSGKKISIECPIHGTFKQLVVSHYSGSGCLECSIDARGWTYTRWLEQAKGSKRFKSFKLYIIKLDSGIYKIGRTFVSIKERFCNVPFSYKVIHLIISEDGREICELESKFKNLCADYQVIPDLEFGGKHECFSSIDPIIKFLE